MNDITALNISKQILQTMFEVFIRNIFNSSKNYIYKVLDIQKMFNKAYIQKKVFFIYNDLIISTKIYYN